MSDKIATKEHEVKVRLRLVNGKECEVEFPRNLTVGRFINAVADHFKLHYDSWELVLHSDKGITYLSMEDCLGDCLHEVKNAYLRLHPIVVAG